jgi:thiamine biosynthesis lipoprotein
VTRAAAALLLATLALPGCADLERYEYREVVMGSAARIALYAPDEAAARAAARAAFDRMAALDGVMSDWRDDSELMRLCRRAGETVAVSDDLFAVLVRAGEITAASDGAFDVTIGPVVRQWRETRRTGRLADPAERERALDLVGWRLVTLDPGHRTVRLARPGMRLDLGGIGKGFAADAARIELARRGVRRCLVDLGGDLVAGDAPPGSRGWRVAVAPHGDADEGGGETILLRRRAVATSGDRYQFVEIDGVRHSHIVDPRTGVGLTTGVAVTVLAPDATTADALASALSVIGDEDDGKRARALLASFPGCEMRMTPQKPSDQR